MFEPKITFTSEITSALQRIDNIRDLIRLIPIMPPFISELRRTALIDTVHYSTKIEGNLLTREDVERILDGHRAAGSQKDKQELFNLQKAMEFVDEIASNESIRPDEEIIKQINALILRDIPDAKTPGAYRTGHNYIQDNRTGEIIFIPPIPWDVPNLVREFSTWLIQSSTGLSPILQAGVAHLELVAIHPFWDGNGRTARALASMLMFKRGYKMRRLFSWEGHVGRNTETYHEAIRASLGEKYGGEVNLTPWLEYFCRSIASSLEALRSDLKSMRRYWEDGYRLGAKLGLNLYQMQAFYYASRLGSVRTLEYVQATGVSRATAVRHLKNLIDIGLLKPVGKGRVVKYILSDDVQQMLAEKKHTERE